MAYFLEVPSASRMWATVMPSGVARRSPLSDGAGLIDGLGGEPHTVSLDHQSSSYQLPQLGSIDPFSVGRGRRERCGE